MTEQNENTVKTNVDEQSQMLCNVIVRATNELHVKQGKTRMDIQTFLKNDCHQLPTSQLSEKCENLVERHGNEIYAHVASNVELSQICDYLDSSAFQSKPPVRCELCTFVLAMAKQMLDAEHTEDKVLLYIDEQVCSRLTGTTKKKCKEMIDNNGREFIRNLQSGTQPILLCTQLQLCHKDIVDTTSPIQKDEMHSFLTKNLCGQLGSLQSACEALIEKDGTRLLQILTNEIEGNELCHMFGLCPKKSPLLNDLALKDDPSKCKRCVKDFTRRKHIAERLVNRSSEFLHHLCEQLPEKDDCIKSVDDSLNDLVTFIRSLDPRAICVQLNMCDQKSLNAIQLIETIPSDNVINEEIVEYLKDDVCHRLGSLSTLCIELAETEGLNLMNIIAKKMDPHQICTVLDVCPSSSAMTNCQDKCQCCINKVEIYQKQLEKFMRTIVASTRVMCDHVPGRDTCLRLADIFESNVDKTVAKFDSKRICQMLSLCSSSEIITTDEQCGTCQTELNSRQNRFRTTVNGITKDLLSFCSDNNCRSRVQFTQQELLTKIDNLNTQKVCQHLGYCLSENAFEPSTTLLRLRSLAQHQTKILEERLQAHDICSEFGHSKTICEHLMTSVDSRRYAYVYLSLLTNNPTLIDEDLREHLSTKVNADVCQSCKNAVQSTKDFWANSLDSVRDVLLRTCDYCPSKDECREYYNRRFDGIKAYLANIDADDFCKSIRLCSTNNLKTAEEISFPSINNLSEESESDEVNDSNSTCILCEYVMNTVSNYIRQDSTEQEIEQSLQKVCNQMPASLRVQCHEMINNYGPSIVATLLSHFDPTTICQKLNLCTKQMKVELSHITKANQASCGVCDYISTYINFALKRDSSDRSLERALSTVCSHLSTEHHAACQTIVELFRPHMRKVNLQLGNNFCKQLALCQTPMAELKPAVHLHTYESQNDFDDEELKHVTLNNLDSTPQCTLCHYVVSYLDAVLKNNKSEAAVEAALARVCSILPRKERPKCGEFIKTYGPVLADLITELADPRLVCRYLGMCQVLPSQETKPIMYSNHQYARIPV
ncbi:hypothetical protein I4U23_007752 [Adineta vaga]|nr:hypothetical protein I4U23_007752 [Adineta vaga]